MTYRPFGEHIFVDMLCTALFFRWKAVEGKEIQEVKESKVDVLIL